MKLIASALSDIEEENSGKDAISTSRLCSSVTAAFYLVSSGVVVSHSVKRVCILESLMYTKMSNLLLDSATIKDLYSMMLVSLLQIVSVPVRREVRMLSA